MDFTSESALCWLTRFSTGSLSGLIYLQKGETSPREPPVLMDNVLSMIHHAVVSLKHLGSMFHNVQQTLYFS